MRRECQQQALGDAQEGQGVVLEPVYPGEADGPSNALLSPQAVQLLRQGSPLLSAQPLC